MIFLVSNKGPLVSKSGYQVSKLASLFQVMIALLFSYSPCSSAQKSPAHRHVDASRSFSTRSTISISPLPFAALPSFAFLLFLFLLPSIRIGDGRKRKGRRKRSRIPFLLFPSPLFPLWLFSSSSSFSPQLE